MTSPARCSVLWNQTQDILKNGVPGCFVECGVWRGGSAALMALAVCKSGESRDLHLFDSFEGLPEPTEDDGAAAIAYSGGRVSGVLKSLDKCIASLDEVRELLLDDIGFDPSRVHFHKGWFQNTVPFVSPNLGPIALLRLDGDWYESTKCCLEQLYDLVVPGGFVILDDYGYWEGCRRASDEFFDLRKARPVLTPVDGEGFFFRKGSRPQRSAGEGFPLRQEQS